MRAIMQQPPRVGQGFVNSLMPLGKRHYFGGSVTETGWRNADWIS